MPLRLPDAIKSAIPGGTAGHPFHRARTPDAVPHDVISCPSVRRLGRPSPDAPHGPPAPEHHRHPVVGSLLPAPAIAGMRTRDRHPNSALPSADLVAVTVSSTVTDSTGTWISDPAASARPEQLITQQPDRIRQPRRARSGWSGRPAARSRKSPRTSVLTRAPWATCAARK
jgi:hypothetical protein